MSEQSVFYTDVIPSDTDQQPQTNRPKSETCMYSLVTAQEDSISQHQLAQSHPPSGEFATSTNTRAHRRRLPPPPPPPPRVPIKFQTDSSVPSATAAPTLHSIRCPITSNVFRDPVQAEDGYTYERQAIIEWIRTKGTSPITQQPLQEAALRSSLTMKELVEELHAKIRFLNAKMLE